MSFIFIYIQFLGHVFMPLWCFCCATVWGLALFQSFCCYFLFLKLLSLEMLSQKHVNLHTLPHNVNLHTLPHKQCLSAHTNTVTLHTLPHKHVNLHTQTFLSAKTFPRFLLLFSVFAAFSISKVLDVSMVVFQLLNGTSLWDFSCVFWNYSLEDWSVAGCWKGNASDGVLQCFCNHTTNFAALWVKKHAHKFHFTLNVSYIWRYIKGSLVGSLLKTLLCVCVSVLQREL